MEVESVLPVWQRIDTETVCRICLESKTDLFLIFEEKYAVDKIPLAEVIKECSNFDVLYYYINYISNN